jgi:hypothetical protein
MKYLKRINELHQDTKESAIDKVLGMIVKDISSNGLINKGMFKKYSNILGDVDQNKTYILSEPMSDAQGEGYTRMVKFPNVIEIMDYVLDNYMVFDEDDGSLYMYPDETIEVGLFKNGSDSCETERFSGDDYEYNSKEVFRKILEL